MSYGCDAAMLDHLAAHCSARRLDQLAACVPERHRQFIRNLPPAYEDDDVFVVHGKWDPDELAERPGIAERLQKSPALRHRLLWGRFSEEELPRVKAWQRTGYFGHTPVSFYTGLARGRRSADGSRMVPVVGNKMVLVDTAVALGLDGRLSALCAETGLLIQADHWGNVVPVVQAPASEAAS
jgi:serine/threonine protein phosphatase 1